MARVPFVNREVLDPEGQEIYDRIRKDRNAPEVGQQFRALLHSQKATSHLTSMGTQLRFHSSLPEPLKEVAILLIVREWNSHIEWTAHSAIAMKAGVSKEVIESIRQKQAQFDLRRTLVLQPEIIGANKSFQVLLDPSEPEHVQVVALTDQLVEADGKTYRSSINHPITAETVEHVGAANTENRHDTSGESGIVTNPFA